MSIKWSIVLTTVALALVAAPAAADPAPRHLPTVTLDAQSWNPLSLVVRERHLAETLFGDDIKVAYLPAADSTSSLARLQAGITDFASASTLAASVARAYGAHVRIILVSGVPTWSAVMVRPGASISTVGDLKGRRVAVGDEEARFCIDRALAAAGLGPRDIVPVPQSQLDGRMALEREQVDGWVATDPQRAAAERESGDRPLADAAALAVPAVLVVREATLAAHPDWVAKLTAAYDQARLWAESHPQDLTKLVAQAAAISPEAAGLALDRTRFAVLPLDQSLRDRLTADITDLKSYGRLSPEIATDTLVDGLVPPPRETSVTAP